MSLHADVRVADWEAQIRELQARIRELEASRDQYQEWAIDYERRIAKAKAILHSDQIWAWSIPAALAALEGK